MESIKVYSLKAMRAAFWIVAAILVAMMIVSLAGCMAWSGGMNEIGFLNFGV